MPKKTKVDPKDLNIFQEAVKDATPLQHNKIRLTPTRSIKPPQRPREVKLKEEVPHITESAAIPEVKGEEFISYKQLGVANKTLRNLRKGQYNVEATLDLHGMTISQAKSAVNSFLQTCFEQKVQMGLIIHGKGLHSEMPILKNKLNHWLRSAKIVLAFCSASSRHGSRGATYVLLKRT